MNLKTLRKPTKLNESQAMKSPLTIFLIGVSHEFGSFNDAVENEIVMNKWYVENRPGFPLKKLLTTVAHYARQ